MWEEKNASHIKYVQFKSKAVLVHKLEHKYRKIRTFVHWNRAPWCRWNKKNNNFSPNKKKLFVRLFFFICSLNHSPMHFSFKKQNFQKKNIELRMRTRTHESELNAFSLFFFFNSCKITFYQHNDREQNGKRQWQKRMKNRPKGAFDILWTFCICLRVCECRYL